MSGSHTLSAIVAVIAAAQLAGCANQPASTYSYYPVPCAPMAAVGAPPAPNDASPGESPTTATPSPASALNAPPDAAGTPQPTAPSCVAAIPNYDYVAGYDPSWDYGWPDYRDIDFGGSIGEDFHRGFRHHDFHGGGLRGGRFHGGGFHGGGGHGGGRR